MPGLLCWLETSIFAAWLHWPTALRLRRRHRAATLLLLHVGQELGILQELLSDAHAVSVDVTTDLVHHAPLLEPPHHFLARRSRIHHAKIRDGISTVLAALKEMLPGLIEHRAVSHRRHLHVGFETHMREFFALLFDQLTFEGLGILEQEILDLRLRLLALPLLLPRLVVAYLRFQTLTC